MDGRRARLISPALDRVPRLTSRSPTPPRQATEARQPGELKTGWAALLGIGWPLAIVVIASIEPAPADPNAAPALLDSLLTAVMFGALVLTGVSAVSRLRATAFAGVTLGVVGLGAAAACPLSGHHEFGLWWIGELAIYTAMLAASIAALGRRARTT